MAGALSRIKKVGQAAEKAAEKTKGLGERAAEAALKTEKTARDRAMIEAAKAAKQGFLEPSVEKDVLYHGTRSDISKFIPGERGAVFLTQDIDFANDYAPTSQMLFLNELPNSPNVMPVYAQVRNPFDYENPEHIDMVLNKANLPKAVDPQKIRDNLELGNWNYIEDKNIQQAIKDLGFDAFYIKEQGLKNIGVFDPKRIKSAIGMQGSYDITDPDITKAEGGAVTPDVVGGGTGIPLKKGGKVDHKLKEWYAAQGGFTDSYEQGLESQEKKASDIAAYKQGKVGADALLRYFPGLSAAMVEEQLNPQMAKGGEVKMQGGGDPTAQIQQQLSQGVPVQMVPGKYGDIARQLIQIEEAARKKQEEERKARVEALPLADRLGGRLEAAKTIGSAVGKSMVAPYVALAKGEEYAKQFSEDIPIPKTEAGAYYTGTAAEMLETPAKFLEAAKIPDTPLTELVPTQYLPGLGRQLSGIAGKAAKKVDEVIPESLKSLPVGMSTKSVGPEGEKVSINELIRRLEAGEEMTPEQRQKAEYSKAQKEKYAAANVAKAEKKAAKTTEYRGRHTAPGRESGAPLFDVTGGGTMYPDDIYSSKGAQYYGHFGKNDPMDMESISIIQGLRGDPNAEVTIYRAVPKDEKITTINPGDWVTINPEYAKYHGDSVLRGDYKIVSKRVPVGDVFTNADSIHEFGYDPVIAKKSAEVRVPANQSGFFSSVEKAAANLKREEGSGDAFLSDIMKFNPSKGELEATGIVQFLKGKKNVTRQEVNDFINQNKVEIEEVIRGRDILTESERTKLNEIERALSKGWYDIPEQDLDWYESTKQRLLATPAARFDRESLMLPGGTNYKEILLKFPSRVKEGEEITVDIPNNWEIVPQSEVMGGNAFDVTSGWYVLDGRTDIRGSGNTIEEAIKNAKIDPSLPTRTVTLKNKEGANYVSQHWPDDPNTFLHLRMQDMKIGGKKTLVIEEIQSDWHQTGRKKGYNKLIDMPKMSADELLVRHGNDMTPEQRKWLTDFEGTWDQASRSNDQAKMDALTDQYETWLSDQKIKGVPDAPFKKDWYQLGMKRLLKYAADNDYDQIALVGPEEQIRRGSLGTHVDGVSFEKNPDGSIKLIAEKGESVVFNETVKPENLELYVGKDVAKKILESKDIDGTLTGDDLKIGGEGMRQYYDRNYPEVMNKLGRDYQTQAKKTNFVIKEFEPDDVEEVDIGEVDRFRRPVMGYRVRDRETGEEVAFEYDFDKALNEANKKAPSTSMWLMDLPSKMKSDVKIGQPFAKGGAVKVDSKLREWYEGQKMAGGGISKVAKAAGKAGEKAKRMSKAEGEALGLYHDISSTKLPKPLSEVQKKVVLNPKSQMQEKRFVSPEKLQGGIGVQLLGDRAAAGQILEELEGIPIGIELQGGPGYIQEHGGWASHKVPLSKLERKIRREQESGDPVYGIYSAMGPQGVDFNTFVSEAILKSLDLGALRKKDIQKFNNEMRKDIPKFVGLESPELYISLMTGPGAQRTKFVETVAKDDYQKVGFPNAAFARYGITEEELLNVPIGESGRTIARFGPEMVMEQKSGHKTYPYDLTGEYFGGLETPLPMEVMFPTFFEARRLLSKPQSGDYRAMQMSTPVQYFDQHWLDNAMKYLEMQKKLTGRKKGGLAHVRK